MNANETGPFQAANSWLIRKRVRKRKTATAEKEGDRRDWGVRRRKRRVYGGVSRGCLHSTNWPAQTGGSINTARSTPNRRAAKTQEPIHVERKKDVVSHQQAKIIGKERQSIVLHSKFHAGNRDRLPGSLWGGENSCGEGIYLSRKKKGPLRRKAR